MTTTEVKYRFQANIDAIVYFEHLRWGGKARCAYCNSAKISARQIDTRFHCNTCHKTFSVTVGTFLHGSRVSPRAWIYAFAAVADVSKKFTVKQLEREINVSYTTAWLMYRDIKKLMDTETGVSAIHVDLFMYLCRKAIEPFAANEILLSEAV